MIVRFPDGSRVRASSILDRRVDDPERSFGLYLDARWQPSWPADLIEWRDFGLPEDAESAARKIEDAFMRARRGELVEVGCLGGSGRTGTVLACMATLAGVPPTEAVAWVRHAYKAEAVETVEQEEWVRWFAAGLATRVMRHKQHGTASHRDQTSEQVDSSARRSLRQIRLQPIARKASWMSSRRS